MRCNPMMQKPTRQSRHKENETRQDKMMVTTRCSMMWHGSAMKHDDERQSNDATTNQTKWTQVQMRRGKDAERGMQQEAKM